MSPREPLFPLNLRHGFLADVARELVFISNCAKASSADVAEGAFVLFQLAQRPFHPMSRGTFVSGKTPTSRRRLVPQEDIHDPQSLNPVQGILANSIETTSETS